MQIKRTTCSRCGNVIDRSFNSVPQTEDCWSCNSCKFGLIKVEVVEVEDMCKLYKVKSTKSSGFFRTYKNNWTEIYFGGVETSLTLSNKAAAILLMESICHGENDFLDDDLEIWEFTGVAVQ